MMSDSINRETVVLIDPLTRSIVDKIDYANLSTHTTIITDIKELGSEHSNTNLVMFASYVHIGSTLAVLEEVKNAYKLELYIVYNDEKEIPGLSEIAHLFKCDYTSIDWNLVYAVVTGDYALLEVYQNEIRTVSSFEAVRERVPEDLQEYFVNLYKGSLGLLSRQSAIIEENTRLQELLRMQEQVGTRMMKGIRGLKTTLDNHSAKIKEYEMLLSGCIDFTVSGFYPDRPKILYIKRTSHVPGMDILLNILYFVITQQYKSSCKIVKLVDPASATDARYIPNNYLIIRDTYRTNDVLQSDFVVKMGAYQMLFDLLLLNRSTLNYLIIHDMRGVRSDALDTQLMDVKICEMTSDYAVLGEHNLVISEYGKVSDFQWTYKECSKYNSTDIQRMTGHPTVTGILDLFL